MDVVYLNGAWLPLHEARVPVLDRGFLFGDGVYEVIPLYQGRFFRLPEHLSRLQHSLDGIRLTNPHTPSEWQSLFESLVARNPSAPLQTVYVQVTRGAAPRDLAFPAVPPTVFAMLNVLTPPAQLSKEPGVAAITCEDIRWRRCDIKAITLLPNALMRQQALDAGVQDALIVRDGEVLEGTASNVFVVHQSHIWTPPKSTRLLPGITREVVLELAVAAGLNAGERPLSVQDLRQADEIWLTSSNKDIQPVTRLDGRPVGSGSPGPVWRQVTLLYIGFKKELLS